MRISRVVAAIATVVALTISVAVPAEAASTVSISVKVKDNWSALTKGCVTVRSSAKTAKDCTVNSSGAFTFAGLPKATYTISASGFPNHDDAVLPTKATFTTSTAYSTTGTLKRHAYVRGTVQSETGEPISGVKLAAVPFGAGSSRYSTVNTTTSPSGAYAIYLPGAINWRIYVGPSEVFGTYPYPNEADTIVSSYPNLVKTFNINVPAAGSVSGTLAPPPGVAGSDVCASLHAFGAGTTVAFDCGVTGESFVIEPVTPGTYFMCVGAPPVPATCNEDVYGSREVLGRKSHLLYSSEPGRIQVSSNAQTSVDVVWGGTYEVATHLDNGARVSDGCVRAVAAARGLDVSDCSPVNGVFSLDIPMDLEEGVATTFSLFGARDTPDTTWSRTLDMTSGVTRTEYVALPSRGTGSITVGMTRDDSQAIVDGCAYLLLGTTAQKTVAKECGLDEPVVFDGLAEGDYAVKVVGISGSLASLWVGETPSPTPGATWSHLADGEARALSLTVPTTQTVSGMVRDTAGNPLSGGSVELVGADGQVLASSVVVAGAYSLTTPIRPGLVRAVNFDGFADAFIGNRYQYSPDANTTGPNTAAVRSAQNFVLAPSAALTGTIVAPGYLGTGEFCVRATQSGYNTFGPASCGNEGDAFRIPVVPGTSYYLCVTSDGPQGACASSSTGSDLVGTSFSPVAFAAPLAGGDIPIAFGFGGTYRISVAPSGSSEVLRGGCIDVLAQGVVVANGCADEDGIATVLVADDYDPYVLSARAVGYRGAYDTSSNPWGYTGVSNGAQADLRLVATSWPVVTGSITRPAGFAETHACAFVTDLAGTYEETCLAPGQSVYALRALPGIYYVGFYTEEPGVAFEWFDNKPTLAGAKLVTISAAGTPTANATLEASGRMAGTVTGPGGVPATGGCVQAYDSNGDLAQGDCVDGDGAYALESLPSGSYTVRFTGFDGLAGEWYPAGASRSTASEVTVAVGATTTVNATLEPAARLSGRLTLGGTDAKDGCVALYTPSGDFYEDECVDDFGAYSFNDILPGKYYVRASGFTQAADTWVGGSYVDYGPAVSIAGDVERVLDVSLARGGSISGSVEMITEDTGLRTVALVDMNGVELDRVVASDTNPMDYRVDWAFSHIPAGTYKIRYIKGGATQWQWHVAKGEVAPAKITLSSANSLTVTKVDAARYINGGRRSMWGNLNVPSSWSSSTVCAIALNSSGYVLSADCGKRGGEFLVTSLGSSGYALVFTNGEIRTEAQFKAFKGSKKWYGSGPPLYYTLGSGGAAYFPVWFFPDVTYKTANFEIIQWMGDQGIFRGYSDGTFKPGSSLTRRDFAIYLYRAQGSPAVALPSKSPFADVSATDPAYKALLWMRSNGYWTSTAYKPASGVDRRTEALILYRAAGSPAVTLPTKSPFTDVAKSDPAFKAIYWATKYKIVPKATSTTFAPSTITKRGSGAAHLYEWWWQFG